MNVIELYHKMVKQEGEEAAHAGGSKAKDDIWSGRTKRRRLLLVDYFAPVQSDQGGESERIEKHTQNEEP